VIPKVILRALHGTSANYRFEAMWMYLLVFLAALIVDTIPVFAPPAWTVLVLLLLTFHLNPWLVVIIGVTGSTLGRYILSLYIPKISSALVSRREDENLRYVGSKLAQTPLAASTFVFLYTLTPLSTTALFTAAGMARVNPWHILPPFFCGRLITDGVMVYTGKYAAGNVSGLLHGQLSIKSVLTLIAGLLVICAFLFIDWRCLLQKRKLRVNFKILR
jgi:membrane protein DedA with SNARE-associated domain